MLGVGRGRCAHAGLLVHEYMGPIREGEWNYVQFRPNGPGLRLEDGFLPASIDPDLGYRGEDQVRFGQRPMVYGSWHR